MIVELEAAETTVPALLERIRRGEEVRLLEDGRNIATITPDANIISTRRTPEQIAEAHAALAAMDTLSRELKLSPFNFEEFKQDRDFGRK